MAERAGYIGQAAHDAGAHGERNEYGASVGAARRPGARTRTEQLPRRRAATTGLTYEQAHQKIEWAYMATLHDDYAKAASELGAVDAWLDHVASGKALQDTFGGRSGAVEQARGVVGLAAAHVATTLFVLKQGHNASRGAWKATLASFKAAKHHLVTLSGEVAFEDNDLLVGLESMTSDAYKVHAAIASIPVALAIGAYAAPLIAQELTFMGGEAVLGFVLANPVLATELGVFAVGMTLSIAMSGGIDEYLAQLETPDGQRQAIQDLVILLEMAVTHQPGSVGPRPDDGPSPAPPPRDRRVRVWGNVEETEDGQLRARIVRVEDDEKVREAVAWADGLAANSTEDVRDPANIEKRNRAYFARQDAIDEAYAEIMSGEKDPPPGVGRERLRDAREKNPKSGERLPLTFPDVETYKEFQAELRAIFESEGITDAVVQQVGSATTGFKGNPKKEFGPWTPESDADFAVFSGQALVQAMEVNAVVNRHPDVTMNGRYTVLKSNPTEGKGFYDTSLGAKLDELAEKWRPRLWPEQREGGGMDFKLNLATAPFTDAATIIDMKGEGK